MHGYRHVPLPHLSPATFREETARGRALLEDLSGAAVVGYRAPTFSLVPASRWAVDELSELGFTYSSSVLLPPRTARCSAGPDNPVGRSGGPEVCSSCRARIPSFGSSLGNPYRRRVLPGAPGGRPCAWG